MSHLIALMGKREYPDEHGDYMFNILALMKSKFLLGITLLKATSYEVISTKADCSYNQKSKFLQTMIIGLGDILQLLNKFLTLCVCIVSNNELIGGSDLDFDIHNALPNDDRFVFCCTELLSTISSMFSWIPTNFNPKMSIEFFNNIYELCTYTSEKFNNIHISAVLTISELFYLQKAVPQISCQANGITELINQKYWQQSSEEYQDRLTELFKLFIQQHWVRFVNQPEFPAKDFLLHLFNFTFTENASALTFAERLSMFIPIIKSFDEKMAPRYTETIIQVISNVIIKIQFQYNNDLETLDTDELDENMETELQSFRNNCIEVILTAAEVEPCKIFDLLYNEINKEYGYMKNLVTILNSFPDYTKNSTKSHASLNQIVHFTADPAFYVHCMCKDLITLLQVIAQTCEIVSDRAHSIANMIKSFIYVMKVLNQKKLYNYTHDLLLKNELIELQAQFMSSVRSVILLKSEIYGDHNEIFQIIDNVMKILLPPNAGEPLLILNAATQLIVTISGILRPNYFLSNHHVQELLRSDLSHFDSQIKLQIKRIVFNALTLPYNHIAVNLTEDQEYEKRSEFLKQYVAFISYKFLSMSISENSENSDMRTELNDYEHLLSFYVDTNNFSKQILLSSLNCIVKKSIEIFQFIAKNANNSNYNESDISSIIDFNLAVVKCLQTQIGADFVINIVRLFLEISSLPNQSSLILNKLLKMLIYITAHTSATTNFLMPDILKLTIEDLLPISQNQQADIAFNLFTLYDAILQNFSYFQKPSSTNTTRNNEDDLIKILTAYGQFLCNGLSSDPNCGRVILTSLERLNEKWRLYDKAFFKNFLLKSFLCTFVRLIVSPDGALFHDQLIAILFQMSVKSKALLHESLSLVFNDEAKIVYLCEINDLPTFANYMEILIIDYNTSH
jgi:hypothetical protein